MPTVLIIDSDVVLLAQLATQLEEQGYTTLRATTTIQGEQQIADHRPDLILLDPSIQQGNGWNLLERLAPRVSVMVISGAGLEEEVVRGFDLGAADYLTKPFRSTELLVRIRRILRSTPETPAAESTASLPSTTNPVDRLRRSSVEQQRPADFGEPRPGTPALGERRIEVSAPDRGKRNKQEEPVFISPEEEHQLFARAEAANDELRIAEVNALPLGQRLKTARQRRRITLVQAELDTRIRMSYIQAMEEEKFSLLPSGPASEDMLRAYATYLGLDMPAAQSEYRSRHFSPPTLPPPALGGLPPIRQLPRWIAPAAAIVLALLVGLGAIWLRDPGIFRSIGERARSVFIPAPVTPIPPPTTISLPTPTATLRPTATSIPTPTRSPIPTEPVQPTPVLTPNGTPKPTN